MQGKKSKYHIKFDDGDKSIYLNVRLDQDEYWTKVYEEDARVWVKQLRREDAERVGSRFNRPRSVGSQDVRQLSTLGDPSWSGTATRSTVSDGSGLNKSCLLYTSPSPRD